MQTLPVPCPAAAQLSPFSCCFPAEDTRNPSRLHAKLRHFPRKLPQFSLRTHAISRFRTLICAAAPRERVLTSSSNSATEPRCSARQVDARDNKRMQLSTTAIPAREKGAHEPLTLYYLVFVFTVCSILGLILETIVSYFVDGRWASFGGRSRQFTA